jgi:hypothetical protein
VQRLLTDRSEEFQWTAVDLFLNDLSSESNTTYQTFQDLCMELKCIRLIFILDSNSQNFTSVQYIKICWPYKEILTRFQQDNLLGT